MDDYILFSVLALNALVLYVVCCFQKITQKSILFAFGNSRPDIQSLVTPRYMQILFIAKIILMIVVNGYFLISGNWWHIGTYVICWLAITTIFPIPVRVVTLFLTKRALKYKQPNDDLVMYVQMMNDYWPLLK
jgi:hypothetical protein